jgi:hypothetical protein
MFPSYLDGGFHVVCQDDKLARSAVVIRAKTYDVNLSHSGRERNGKTRGEQEGALPTKPRASEDEEGVKKGRRITQGNGLTSASGTDSRRSDCYSKGIVNIGT